MKYSVPGEIFIMSISLLRWLAVEWEVGVVGRQWQNEKTWMILSILCILFKKVWTCLVRWSSMHCCTSIHNDVESTQCTSPLYFMNYYLLMAPKASVMMLQGTFLQSHAPLVTSGHQSLSSWHLCCAMNMVTSFIPPAIVLADLSPGSLLPLISFYWRSTYFSKSTSMIQYPWSPAWIFNNCMIYKGSIR